MFLMNITRGAASGRGVRWGALGAAEAARGERGPAWGMGLRRGEGWERAGELGGGGRRVASPQPSPPSLSPLLGVTEVQENYANEDKRLSQRGSLS